MPPEDFWDQRYSRADFHFGEEPNAFLAREAHRLSAGQRVLAVADGEGRNGVFLAERGLAVHAIDSSRVGREKALRLAERRGVSIVYDLVDIAAYEWPDAAYDAVVGIFFQFAAPPLQGEILAGMARALRPGSILLIEGYRPEQLAYGTGGPDAVENLYTEALLRAAFADLEILSLKSYDAVIHEGRGHQGMSALVDLVARRPLTRR